MNVSLIFVFSGDFNSKLDYCDEGKIGGKSYFASILFVPRISEPEPGK